jgi:hypothetical protein
MAILARYEGSCMLYILVWYWNKKYHQILITYWYSKNWNPWYRYVIANQEKDDTSPALDHFSYHICTEYAWQWPSAAQPNNVSQFINVVIPCMPLILSKCMWPKNWWQWVLMKIWIVLSNNTHTLQNPCHTSVEPMSPCLFKYDPLPSSTPKISTLKVELEIFHLPWLRNELYLEMFFGVADEVNRNNWNFRTCTGKLL